MTERQRVNMDIDKKLWKKVGIRAIKEETEKRLLVEKALEEYLRKREDGKMTTILVDYENNAETWWDAARSHPNPPEALRPLLEVGGPDSIEVTKEEASEIQTFAESLPGWKDGPEYAPRALIIEVD